MREIKFRAWDGVDFMTSPFTLQDIQNRIVQFTTDVPIMQYTGLHDKNGKEIYEGDIVKTGTDKLMVISWSKKHASFVIDRDGWAFVHYFGEAFDSDDCEVIGNIYQNPELIHQP